VIWDDPPSPREPNRVKGAAYEGGVNVPLEIRRGQARRIIGHAVYLFATIIELAGGEAAKMVLEDTTLGSVSFANMLLNEVAPPRIWVFRGPIWLTQTAWSTQQLLPKHELGYLRDA
jgi:arylsulfatase A-like enzyme